MRVVNCCGRSAGQHYAHSLTHKIEMKLHLETDPSEVIDEIIYCTRKVPLYYILCIVSLTPNVAPE